MKKEKLLRKWNPLIESYLNNINIEDEVKLHIAEYLENILNDPYDTNISQKNNNDKIVNIFNGFYQSLLNDNEEKIKIIDSFYNTSINKIVYELENGDFVHLEYNTIKMKNEKSIQKKINKFNNIINEK